MGEEQDTGKFRSNLADKFYTAPAVAADCLAKLMQVLPLSPRDYRWIEPSAGAGAFVDALRKATGIIATAIDLEPAAPTVSAGDFLTWNCGAKDNSSPVIVFGNPPFGRQGVSARKFIRRAAELKASLIAFILPRSFSKPSMQRAFPLRFHLLLQSELPGDAFLVGDAKYSVPCVFQVWELRSTDRVNPAPIQPVGFRYVKQTQHHDLVVRRVGVCAGRAVAGRPRVSAQSHYFLALDQPDKAIRGGRGSTIGPIAAPLAEAVATALSKHEFPSNTTGPRSLSRGEIAEVLNKFLAVSGRSAESSAERASEEGKANNSSAESATKARAQK